MKTQRRWEKERHALGAARLLAEFANLEAESVEGFRGASKHHREFLPDIWWTMSGYNQSLGTHKTWVAERDQLRAAWDAEFPANKTLELTTSPAFLTANALSSDSTGEMESTPQKVWPYQHAVLYLHVNAWRAKKCEWCGRRFIGEHPKARFCANGVAVDGNEATCFWAHRKKYKTEKWNKNSETINDQRRREYLAAKRRKGRAKRKNLRQR
jgi:hypothetical protein